MSAKRQKTNKRVNEALRGGGEATPKMVLEAPIKRSQEHEALNAFMRRAPGSLQDKGDGR